MRSPMLLTKEVEASDIRLNHLLDRRDRALGLGEITQIRRVPGRRGSGPLIIITAEFFEDSGAIDFVIAYGPTEKVKVAIPI